jgi:hypothetical protein
MRLILFRSRVIDVAPEHLYRPAMLEISVEPRERQLATRDEIPAIEVDRVVRTCPNCGRTLLERGCKLACPDPACGFFLSCADYV